MFINVQWAVNPGLEMGDQTKGWKEGSSLGALPSILGDKPYFVN